MENEIMNEETFEVVNEVMETAVAENNNGLGKVAIGAGLGALAVAAGYGVYKGVRWCVGKIKERKALKEMQNTVVIDKRTTDEDESK